MKENVKELLVFIVGDFNEALHGFLWNETFIGDNDQISSNNSLTDCIVDFEEISDELPFGTFLATATILLLYSQMSILSFL